MLKVILKKELLRVFTDRRLVFSTFILPALSIYIIYSLMGTLAFNLKENITSHEATIIIKNAPESFGEYYNDVYLDHNINMKYTFGEINDYEEAIKVGEVDLFIEFEEEFDAKIEVYQSLSQLPEIKTFYNPSNEYSVAARSEMIYSVLSNYEECVLTKRFGNIEYTKAFGIDITNQETEIRPEDTAGNSMISTILPMLLSIILFAGAMGIGMDSIAGEKERGTMATLLVTPVERDKIALGKVLSLSIVSIVSALTSFIAILFALPKMSASFGTEDGEMIDNMTSIAFSSSDLIQLLVLMLILVGMYVAIICIVSVYAKTVKEAGTYISPIYMMIMVAAFSSMYSIGEGLALYKFMIPIYGILNAMKELIQSELTMQEFTVVTFSSIFVTFVLIKLITRAFNNEKIMLT